MTGRDVTPVQHLFVIASRHVNFIKIIVRGARKQDRSRREKPETFIKVGATQPPRGVNQMRRSERIRKKQRRPVVPTKKKASEQETGAKAPKTESTGWYYTHYKKLLIIPFALLILAIIALGLHAARTGDVINRGVSLAGGVMVTVPSEAVEPDNLVAEIQPSYPDTDLETRVLEEAGTQIAVTMSANLEDTSEENVNRFLDAIEQATGVAQEEYSVETIGSTLGTSFFQQTVKALFIAFLFMGFVVFLYFGEGARVKALAGLATLVAGFMMYSTVLALDLVALAIGIGLIVLYARKSVPSVAVILAAFSDIVITLAVTTVAGIEISTAGIAAFLMLIGYSVDTDILLSTRVLKRTKGTVYTRLVGAVKTGLTMNFTTLAAITVALLVAQSAVITQIMTILLIGLIVDMINTWFQNAGILRWYLEKKHERERA